MRLLNGCFLLASSVVAGAACTPADEPKTAGVACDGDLCTLSGNITEDMTLTADKRWLLSGGVFVGDDTDPTKSPTTLTIEPGTHIYGDTATLSFLLITRGSRIVAEGTAEQPIVFTSSADEGSRSRGDWGGLVINGQAPVNGCAGDPCTVTGEAGTGTYGGSVANDNSGVIKYVRIEFPGKLIDDENEFNGLALQGVGSGTTVDFVQVHMGADDCIEFFGGTVNASHLVCTGAGDDNIDWTFGWTGKAQFVVAQQYADAGGHGIEADNNEDNHEISPVSSPTLSNITLIGSPESDSSGIGMLLRRGTHATVQNAVVIGFAEACFDVDDEASLNALGEGIVIENSVFDCEVLALEDEGESADLAAFLADAGNTVDEVELTAAFNAGEPDFRPADGSPLLTGGHVPNGEFFVPADFVGAYGTNNWSANWTTAAGN